MKWYDCKTDLPKKEGKYIVAYKTNEIIEWEIGEWSLKRNRFELYDDIFSEKIAFEKLYNTPIKWAEVDLSEVE